MAALLFLYREVLARPVTGLGEIPRARAPTRLLVVLTMEEVKQVLEQMRGMTRLVALLAQIAQVRGVHLQHGGAGENGGWVALPDTLERKYPEAGRSLQWQRVLPARRQYIDVGTGRRYRHHLHETSVQREMADAVQRSGITKRASCHTPRHSLATHLMEGGAHIREVQELLGHRDVSTTMLHTHVLNRGGLGVRSPADRGGLAVLVAGISD